MKLHDRIMARKCLIKEDEIGPEFMRDAYRDGFKDAKRQSAQLAAEADALMGELAEALQRAAGKIEELQMDNNTCVGTEVVGEADAALKHCQEYVK